MKYLFLDVDGVLNTDAMYDTYHLERDHGTGGDDPYLLIDMARVMALAEVVKELDLHVIISSTWRETHKLLLCLTDCLNQAGILVEGVTPVHNFMAVRTGGWGEAREHIAQEHSGNLSLTERGMEIEEWAILNMGLGDSLVILDDNKHMGRLNKYLVQTAAKGTRPAYQVGKHDRLIRRVLADQEKGTTAGTLILTVPNPLWKPDTRKRLGID